MNNTDTQVMPAPPSLIGALTAGFESVSTHISLILFPVLLDLLLWIGPRLRVGNLVKPIIDQAATMPPLPGENVAETFQTSRELWLLISSQFNLLSLLRTYPVGIPSLMAGRVPVQLPGGQAVEFELPSIAAGIAVLALISLAGLIAGTLYFTLVSQTAITGSLTWRKTISFWPWAALQVLFLALFWITLLLGVSVPFVCTITIVLMGGANAGQLLLIMLLFSGLIIWLLLPLAFSAHGIFVNGRSMWASLRNGVRLTRLTLLPTGLFFLAILVISEGMDILWRIPPDTSWLTLVAVAGHGFITTALLAASFVYYRDADLWIRRLQRIRLA